MSHSLHVKNLAESWISRRLLVNSSESPVDFQWIPSSLLEIPSKLDRIHWKPTGMSPEFTSNRLEIKDSTQCVTCTLGSAIELPEVLRNTTGNKAHYAVFWIGLVFVSGRNTTYYALFQHIFIWEYCILSLVVGILHSMHCCFFPGRKLN